MVDIAGRLRNRITIERKASTPNGRGGFSTSWTAIVTDLPAEVKGISGREAVLAQALQSVETYRITIRYRPAIMPADRIQYDGRELNIRSAADPDGRRVLTEIIADTEAPLGG